LFLFGQNWLTWLDTQGKVKAESWYLLRPNFASIFSKIWSNRNTLFLINFVVFCDVFPDCCIFKNSVPTKQLKFTQNILCFISLLPYQCFPLAYQSQNIVFYSFVFMSFMFIVNFAPTKQTKFHAGGRHGHGRLGSWVLHTRLLK